MKVGDFQERQITMLDITRYPKFNDSPHAKPALSMFGRTPVGELIWLMIPVAVILSALLAR